ncbi:MAG: RNA polymerase sigma factor [Planctomycetota bacterium]|jgi:RNA polymerase sigma-70 factor (ECF subfamily)
MIEAAAQRDEQAATDAMERLVRRYWSAIYAYIRRSGRDVHQAADLTQGFVCDIILSRRLCDYADPNRGRFRTLLLRAIQNYLREQHRREQRTRSKDDTARPLPLGDSDWALADAGSHETPEEAFSYHWSATLVRQVLSTVRAGCQEDGLTAHWTVFENRVVRPMLFDEPPTDYATLVERLELNDESQAANMMITVKRRFVRALYFEIGQTVSDPMQVEDELHELLKDLERPR